MKIPRNLPQPMFVRPNDYISIQGADYIIRRNEFSQMVKVLGRVQRKLPSEKDVIWALKSGRPVGYWGNKYFIYERIDQEIIKPIMQAIWEFDKRRGIDPPDMSEMAEREYDF